MSALPPPAKKGIRVASKHLGATVAYISKRFGETYTYNVEDAREFGSQEEIQKYLRDHAAQFLPGWKLAEV